MQRNLVDYQLMKEQSQRYIRYNTGKLNVLAIMGGKLGKLL